MTPSRFSPRWNSTRSTSSDSPSAASSPREVALTRPALVRRLVLASSAPKGAAGMHGWAREVIEAVGAPEPDPNGYLRVFFTQSASSQRAGQEVFERLLSRASDPDAQTNWQTRQAQYDAVCAWGIPNHALLQRLGAIDQPVFVANGDSGQLLRSTRA